MEKKRTVIMIIGIIIILGVYFLRNFDFDSYINKDIELLDDYEIDSEGLDKISLQLSSTNIVLKENTNEKIRLEYYSNQDNIPEIEYSASVLRVEETETDVVCTGICNVRQIIILYIPTSFTGEYEFSTVSGDIKSEIDIFDNKLNIVTTSGDISLKKINDVNILTTSGDIRIDELANKISIGTTSGDIHINTLDNKENSHITTVSGNVVIDDNHSNCYVEVETTSGDQKINKSNRKSDLILKIRTTSGDVKVN